MGMRMKGRYIYMKIKLSKMILVIAVVLSAILPTTISINAIENVEYEIYPTP